MFHTETWRDVGSGTSLAFDKSGRFSLGRELETRRAGAEWNETGVTGENIES